MSQHLTGRVLVGMLLVVLAGFASLIAAVPVSAHNILEGSDPDNGSEISRLPGDIRLEFDDEILPQLATVIVSGPGGRRYGQGKAVIRRNEIRQSLERLDAAGRYDVVFRIVSADGHPIKGQISFTLAESALSASPGPSASRQASLAQPTPEAVSSNPTPASTLAGPSTVTVRAEVDTEGTRTLVALGVAALALTGVAGLLARRRKDSGTNDSQWQDSRREDAGVDRL